MTVHRGPDPDDDGEVPVDERITVLTRLLAGPDPRDPTGLRGLLGTGWLERYERDGDEAALRTGLAHLHEAARAEPGHPDRIIWWYWLGAGHRELARLHDSLPDFDEALDWLGRALAALPYHDPDRFVLAPQWMEVVTDRFALLARDLGTEPAALHREVERLVTGLESVAPESPAAIGQLGSEAAEGYAYAGLLIGLARLQRYDLTRRRADLDAGIARLDAALRHLPPDTPRLDLARFELADAHQTRWQVDQDPADLDAAIEEWRSLAADHPDRWIRLNCGNLLVERADRTGRGKDATAGIGMLAQVVEVDPTDPPSLVDSPEDAWLAWYDLGRAYQVRWRIEGTPGDLADAGRCLDLALETGVPDDDLLPLVRIDRVRFALEGLERETAARDDDPPPSTARLRTLLAEPWPGSTATGDEATGDEAALLAGLLGYAEMWASGYDDGPRDTTRVRARLAHARRLADAGPGWHAVLDAVTALADLSDADTHASTNTHPSTNTHAGAGAGPQAHARADGHAVPDAGHRARAGGRLAAAVRRGGPDGAASLPILLGRVLAERPRPSPC